MEKRQVYNRALRANMYKSIIAHAGLATLLPNAYKRSIHHLLFCGFYIYSNIEENMSIAFKKKTSRLAVTINIAINSCDE